MKKVLVFSVTAFLAASIAAQATQRLVLGEFFTSTS